MKRALVIDDTKNIRLLLTTCLEINNYEVVTGSNGLEAIELFMNNEFDLAFLDIKMPKFSGTEVLRRIREEGINTPVIIMTAFATVKNAVECTKLGAIAYLQKPFTADRVVGLLDEISHELNKDVNLYLEKSSKLIIEGDFHEALQTLKIALALEPESPEIYKLIGDVLKAKGEVKRSKKFYDISDVLKK
ncbi:response regulator [Clostridium sp.]|uniref:response regulator n=1 Tax=Clostridium sp. TaxID=1506 RepID=UPI002FCB6872